MIPGNTAATRTSLNTVNNTKTQSEDIASAYPVSKERSSQNMNLRFNYRNFQKDSEFSTKNSSKDNFLDYTFLSHRSQLSSEVSKNSKSKDYLFDLTSTWELNIDLLEKFLGEQDWKDTEDKNTFEQIISKVRETTERRNKLRDTLKERKAKILIEKQIIEEYKRKIEENNDYYREQLKEYDENRDNKDEYIKIFEKKLKEVEIYIQKNTKNLVNSKYEIYKDFKMNDFTEANTNACRRKEDLIKSTNKIRINIEDIQKENVLYQDEIDLQVTARDTTDKATDPQQSRKVKEYIDMYRKKIRVIQMRMKLLKSCFDNMTNTLKYLNLGGIVKMAAKKDSVTAESNNNNDAMFNDIDKSAIHLDITKKTANYMDFSIVLNRRVSDETNFNEIGMNKTGLGGNANAAWDISCINKN